MFHSDIRSIPNRECRVVARRARIAGIAGAVLALTGCVAESGPGGNPGEREVVERAPEILGKLETRGGAKLTLTAVVMDAFMGWPGPVFVAGQDHPNVE